MFHDITPCMALHVKSGPVLHHALPSLDTFLSDMRAVMCHAILVASTEWGMHGNGAGGGTMSKFVSVFRELASFSELLHTQVELILVERLQRSWLKVGCSFVLLECPDLQHGMTHKEDCCNGCGCSIISVSTVQSAWVSRLLICTVPLMV